jgi:hypothetical protein
LQVIAAAVAAVIAAASSAVVVLAASAVVGAAGVRVSLRPYGERRHDLGAKRRWVEVWRKLLSCDGA